MTENKDLNQRFDQLEKRLNTLTLSSPFSTLHHPDSRSDEIDLRELFAILWQGRWWVVGITFLFAVAGVFYAKSLPNMYTSEGIYAPAQKEGVGGMAGQLGGLASLAGVNIGGGESNDIEQAMVLMTSWPFLEQVINKNYLKPLLMGVKGWDHESERLIWDNKVYDPVNKKWLREPPEGMQVEPSSYEVYSKLSRMLMVSFDRKTAMFNVSVEHYSPKVAQKWVSILVGEINEAFRARDVAESKKNIAYLEQKVAETSIAEMQAVLYGMIEAQMKTLMLAEVDPQYLIRKVVEPKVSELKSSPNRKIILILAVLLGAFISSAFVLMNVFFRSRS